MKKFMKGFGADLAGRLNLVDSLAVCLSGLLALPALYLLPSGDFDYLLSINNAFFPEFLRPFSIFLILFVATYSTGVFLIPLILLEASKRLKSRFVGELMEKFEFFVTFPVYVLCIGMLRFLSKFAGPGDEGKRRVEVVNAAGILILLAVGFRFLEPILLFLFALSLSLGIASFFVKRRPG